MSAQVTEWILLRGLSRESRHWGNFPQHLGAALNDVSVIGLDLPGNGRRNGMASLSSVEAMADWCHQEIGSLGRVASRGVLAMSLGAMVAVAWAQRHPDDLAAAVLINTSLRPLNPFYHRLRPANYLRLLRLLAFPASDREIETAILQITTRCVADPDQVIEEWLRWRRENPVSRRNVLQQLLAAARFRGPQQRPLQRLLLLGGQRDGLVDVRCSRQLAALWGVPVVVHPDGGHDLPLDDGPWVAGQLRLWRASESE